MSVYIYDNLVIVIVSQVFFHFKLSFKPVQYISRYHGDPIGTISALIWSGPVTSINGKRAVKKY